jgi:hypothetical protein
MFFRDVGTKTLLALTATPMRRHLDIRYSEDDDQSGIHKMKTTMRSPNGMISHHYP